MEAGLLALILAERVGIVRIDRMILARRHGGQSVARRRSGIDELLDPRVPCALEHVDGALHVGRHVLERPLDRRHDVADAGEMEHVARAREQRVVRRDAPHVPALEADRRARQVPEVLLAAAHQVVDDADLVALLDQQVRHVAADEARAAGDDGDWPRAHRAPAAFIVRTLK